MRYQPVKITHFVAVLFHGVTNERLRERHYFKATSRSGDCGHNHKTEDAAGRCLARMRREWKEARYGR